MTDQTAPQADAPAVPPTFRDGRVQWAIDQDVGAMSERNGRRYSLFPTAITGFRTPLAGQHKNPTRSNG